MGIACLFVKKADDTRRMCIDYRALNRKTKKNTYPLPRINDCIDQLGPARVLSTFDLTSGYWQVRIKESGIPKTAFHTRNRKYDYAFRPHQCPSNVPNPCQQGFRSLSQSVSCCLSRRYSGLFATRDEHLNHLRTVLQLLRENHLYAKPTARNPTACAEAIGGAMGLRRNIAV